MTDIADPYTVLDVDRGADADQIRRAFRRLIAQSHPDRSRAADAADRTAAIVSAYRVLSDPERRRQHDRRQSARQILSGADRRRAVRRAEDRSSPVRSRQPALLVRDTAWAAIAIAIVAHAVGPDVRAYQRDHRTGKAIATAVPHAPS